MTCNVCGLRCDHFQCTTEPCCGDCPHLAGSVEDCEGCDPIRAHADAVKEIERYTMPQVAGRAIERLLELFTYDDEDQALHNALSDRFDALGRFSRHAPICSFCEERTAAAWQLDDNRPGPTVYACDACFPRWGPTYAVQQAVTA